MTKDRAVLEDNHNKAADAVESYLKQGKNVVFLTLGDPTIYSTYLYVHKRILERGYQAEIVSGITSFCAVAARLNMGLAEMAEPLHVIPATYKAEEMDDLLKLPGTKVLMKSGTNTYYLGGTSMDLIKELNKERLETDENGVPVLDVYVAADEQVERVDVETYVEGVLAGEMKNDWPLEALKAQAILARTFVLKFLADKQSKYEARTSPPTLRRRRPTTPPPSTTASGRP